jgi:hypothetical protein
MSSETNLVDSDDAAHSSIAMSSPFAQEAASSHRTPRPRLVRVRSTDGNAESVTELPPNHVSNNSISGFSAVSPLLDQQNSSLMESAFYTEATPSLLLPSGHMLGEHGASSATPRVQHEVQKQQAEEEAFLDALGNGRPPKTPIVVVMGDTHTSGGSRVGSAATAAAPAAAQSSTSITRRQTSFRAAAAGGRLCASSVTSSLIGAGGGQSFTLAGRAAESPPTSSSRPGTSLAVTVGGVTAKASACGTADGGSRLGNDVAANHATSLTTSTASTAALFPTTAWVRATLGNDCGGVAAGENDGRTGANNSNADARGGAVLRGDRSEATRLHPTCTTTNNATSAAAGTASREAVAAGGRGGGTAVSGGAPLPHRDTAMRLHEQRVKDALRSQKEMREFSGVLRRLEEEGAQVLREQRRRRHDRYAAQRGSPLRTGSNSSRTHRARGRVAPTLGGGGGAAKRRVSSNSGSGVQGGKSADDLPSDGFSDYTDVDDDDDEVGDAVAAVDEDGLLLRSAHPVASGVHAGNGVGPHGPSAKAAAEMQGAENMARVAFFKLRDRTAREWITLQRRRLEEQKRGPTALHRQLQASQLRLQATRTRGGGTGNGSNEQLLLDYTRDDMAWIVPSSSSAAEVAQGSNKGGEETDRSKTGGDAAGLPLHLGISGPLVISWGEGTTNNTVAPERTTDDYATDSKHHLGAKDMLSVASADDDTSGTSPRFPPCAAECTVSEAPRRVKEGTATMRVSPLSIHSQSDPPSVDQPQHAPAVMSNSANANSSGGAAAVVTATTPTALTATQGPTAAANALLEDERLRRELQRLLFQANECTLYGLEQCLSNKTKPRPATTHCGAGPAGASGGLLVHSSQLKGSAQASGRSPAWVGAAPRPQAPPQFGTPRVRYFRGASLPAPLHRSFGNAVVTSPAASSLSNPSGTGVGGTDGHTIGLLRATSRTESTAAASADTSPLRQARGVEPGGVDEGVATPSMRTSSLPPLPIPSSASSPASPSLLLPGQRATAAAAVAAAAVQTTSLPSVRFSQQTRINSRVAGSQKPISPPRPRRFDCLSSRKKHKRMPLPVEHGVGEHAAALLQHEILLTRRYEMEAERGNAQEIDRACATLQQLLPLRQRLIDEDIQKGNHANSAAVAKAAAGCGGSLLLLPKGSAPPSAETDISGYRPHGDGGGAGTSGGLMLRVTTDAAVDRSYHPQAILQQHRQLLYEEAVRMETMSRYAAHVAYLDVLTQLAKRHVSSVSWPAVASVLDGARAHLRQKAEAGTPAASASAPATAAGQGGRHHPRQSSPGRPMAPLSPRETLQQLITDHLGVLELSQWPVQEVLQHLAVLYRVPLHFLHECIAEQQRRFTHTYNYEERFRAVDRTLMGSGGAATDSVLRLTLRRCRRPPLAPTRAVQGQITSATTAEAAAEHDSANQRGASAAAAAAAAAQAMGMPDIDPRGAALYYIRLRVGQQSVSSSAVPLSSAAAGGSGHTDVSSFVSNRYGDFDDGFIGSGRGTLGGTDAEGLMSGATRYIGGGGPLLSSSAAKVLSFLGQTLTVYLPASGTAAHKHCTGTAATGGGGSGSRVYDASPFQVGGFQHSSDSGDGAEVDDGCVVRVELMQTGVEAPLARGEIDLASMGMSTLGRSGRVQAQNVQIPLKRKGYRPAELKATLEVTQ